MALASTILMIRPAAFGFNPETANNNFFQSKPELEQESLQQKALAEFENMTGLLSKNGIKLIIIDDTREPVKPDAIFPNNWISTSPSGVVSVFPLYASNRRPEKREEILHHLANEFEVKDFQDWSEFEAEGRFLEGTGSMVDARAMKMLNPDQ